MVEIRSLSDDHESWWEIDIDWEISADSRNRRDILVHVELLWRSKKTVHGLAVRWVTSVGGACVDLDNGGSRPRSYDQIRAISERSQDGTDFLGEKYSRVLVNDVYL